MTIKNYVAGQSGRARSRWAGALDNHATDVQKKMDKEQAQSIEHGTRAVNPAQQELLGNPVIGIFLKVASVANQLVKMAPARDLHDPLNEAHRQMTTAHINTKEKLARPGRTPEQIYTNKETLEKIDNFLDTLEETMSQKAKGKRRSTKEKAIEDARDDPSRSRSDRNAIISK